MNIKQKNLLADAFLSNEVKKGLPPLPDMHVKNPDDDYIGYYYRDDTEFHELNPPKENY